MASRSPRKGSRLHYAARRTAGRLAIALLVAAAAAACAQPGAQQDAGEEEAPMAGKTIEQVLEEHTDSLMSIPGVVGTGIGLCEQDPCIRVFVVEKTQELASAIPERLDGYPVDVVETGEVRARE